jgi:hypothetical protein
MRRFLLAFFVAGGILGCAGKIQVQDFVIKAESNRLQENKQFTFGLGGFSLSLGYANRISQNWFLGLGVGGGVDFLNSILASGEHFSDAGLSKDAALLELLHASGYARYQPSNHWQFDFGVRVSYIGHGMFFEDLYYGYFLGGYAEAFAGWRHFKLGSRLVVGLLDDEVSTAEFGLILFPVQLRFIIPW